MVNTLWFPSNVICFPGVLKVAGPALTDVGLIQVLGQPVVVFVLWPLAQWNVCRDLGACQQYERTWLPTDILRGCRQVNKTWDSPKPKVAGLSSS